MSRVLNIEDAHIVRRRHNRTVVGVWHELDGEDVGPVSCHDGCREAELRGGGFGVVRVDVDTVVVRARGKQAAGGGPAMNL